MKDVMLFFIVLFVITGCATPDAVSKPNDDFAILPVSEGHRLMQQCSRLAPEGVSGFWKPSLLQVQEIEKRLPEYVNDRADSIKLSGSFRQYIGIVSHGKKFIYVSTFPAYCAHLDLRRKAAIICDGGFDVWGVEFDPASHSFFDLQVNGFA